MSTDFDDVLNDCLERLARGEDIHQCVGRYPDHEAELFPLLSVAVATMELAASPAYGPEAKAQGLKRLSQALADRGTPRWWHIPFQLWRPVTKPLIIGLMTLFVTVLAAGGTTLASSNSVPGEPLYWVKKTKENISLKIPWSQMKQAQIHAHLASVRGQELRQLIARDRIGDAELLVSQINHHLNESAMRAGIPLPANPVEMPVNPIGPRMDRNVLQLRADLERDSEKLKVELVELMGEVPSIHRYRVQQVMRQSDLGYRILIDCMQQGNSPGRLPFWKVEPLQAGRQR